MKKFLLFFAVTVTLVNFSHGFHAKVLVRKDGSISADGFQGYSNFEKTCIKDDYCTYNLKAPGIAPTDYNSDQNVISKGGQDFEGDQATYNQKIQSYTDFENGWKETSAEIDAMLRSIETINKQLPPILDAIEASLLNTNETYSKIEIALGQISEPCYIYYKSTCDKTTQAPPLTTQNPATQGTEVTQSPGSTAEAGTTTEFTGSTPSPGPTEPAASTTTGPTEASATTGGSTDGASETTTTDSAGAATTSTASDSTVSTTSTS
jgi:hypothetical protein